jgi:hypothetical protein
MFTAVRQLSRRIPPWAWAAACSLLGSVAVGLQIPRHLPHIQDEFANRFAGTTYAQFQLTNPTHPFWRFFESHHILMQPSMMAKYPAAPGLALAVGTWLGDPIFGVWLGGAAFAAAFAWLLRGFFSTRWALLGGVLIGTQFGLTYYWAQTFWGGALTATGGALVFGGARRLWRELRARDALLLGLGVALLMHTRPFEGLLACVVPAGLVVACCIRPAAPHRSALFTQLVLPCGLVIAAAFLFLAYSNFRVTGSPWRLPYLEYEQRHLGTPAFIWQAEPTTTPAFTNPALADFYHDYVQTIRRDQPAVLPMFFARLRLLAADYFGYALGALALLGACWRPTRWTVLALASIALIGLPLVVSYLFMPHYQAPAAALGGLLAITGLRRLFLSLPRRARHYGAVVTAVLVAQGLSLAADSSNQRQIAALKLPPRREKIADALRAKGGRHLIFVRLVKPYYLHDTWVYNAPPIDAQPVVWAWDRGPAENRLLMAYYPDRAAVLMTVRDGKIAFTDDPAGPRPAP